MSIAAFLISLFADDGLYPWLLGVVGAGWFFWIYLEWVQDDFAHGDFVSKKALFFLIASAGLTATPVIIGIVLWDLDGRAAAGLAMLIGAICLGVGKLVFRGAQKRPEELPD
ncbi:MAG: hypothetical protein HKO08_01345 [Erythrobacter sp.]|nr:hypothetical protein [Erythrobacter sp.]